MLRIFLKKEFPTEMLQQTRGECFVIMIANAILLAYADRYFKIEQVEGTSFSEHGATELKN